MSSAKSPPFTKGKTSAQGRTRARSLTRVEVHRAEQLGQDLGGVGAVGVGHLPDRGREEVVAHEDAGVLGEEAEDQPGHETVEIAALGLRVPVGVVLEELHVEAVEASGGLDVDGVVLDLGHRRDAGERQEEAEMVAEIGQGAGQNLAGGQLLRLDLCAVGGEDEAGLLPRRHRAFAQAGECFDGRAGLGDDDVDVVALQDAVHVGLVGVAAAEAVEGRLLVAERLEELEREFLGIEEGFGECGDGLLDFDSVHGPAPAGCFPHTLHSFRGYRQCRDADVAG